MEVRRQVSEEELELITKIRANLDRMKLAHKELIIPRVEGAIGIIVKRPDLEMDERLKGLELIRQVSEELGSGKNAARVKGSLTRMLWKLEWKTEDLRRAVRKAADVQKLAGSAKSAGKKTKKFMIEDGWIIIIGIAVVLVVVVLIIIIIAILTEGKALEALGAVDKLPFDGKLLEALIEISPGAVDTLGFIVPSGSIEDEPWFKKKMQETGYL